MVAAGIRISFPYRVPTASSIPNLTAALLLPETVLSSGINICCAERLPPAKICNLLLSSKYASSLFFSPPVISISLSTTRLPFVVISVLLGVAPLIASCPAPVLMSTPSKNKILVVWLAPL